ncbi:MAG: 50S ribosomal protein L6 [Phycisphaerales bacterium]|nr:50S ribosomal protein L6 [Phycisphaerales bacterium]
MSRLGSKPVSYPSSVTVTLSGAQVAVKGAKGSLSLSLPAGTQAEVNASSRSVTVKRADDQKQSRANHGLARALIANMVRGVSDGFSKRLLIYGTGYNCKLEGKKLCLNIGFMGRKTTSGAQYEKPIPDGIKVTVEAPAARGDNEPAKILIEGCDRAMVGEFAAEVRALRRAEPYKGKGIRYDNEVVKRKQGKAVTGGG